MLDLAKVRHAYFNPPPDDPERALTREELFARYERRRVEGLPPSRRGPAPGRLGRTRLADRRPRQTPNRVRRPARTRRTTSAPPALLVRLSAGRGPPRRHPAAPKRRTTSLPRSPPTTWRACRSGQAARRWRAPFARPNGRGREWSQLWHNLRLHSHLGSQTASFPGRPLRLRSRPRHASLRYVPGRGRLLDQPVRRASRGAGGSPRPDRTARSTDLPLGRTNSRSYLHI